MARTAKAAQSSSGEKQTAIAAPDVTEAAGSAGESVARESDRTRENTLKLWRIRLNSLLPCSGARQIVGTRHFPAAGAYYSAKLASGRSGSQRSPFVKTSRKWDELAMRNREPSPTLKTPATIATATLRQAYGYLAVIIATWAANWPMMRLALDHTEPMVFVSLRMAGSVAIFAPILAALSCPLLPVRRERLALFWIGQLQVTGFLVFSIIGLAIVPPGRAIVLAYTMPLWAIPIGLGLSRELLSFGKFAGVTIGFVGLVLFMNPTLIDWTDPRAVAGNLLLLLAAICWAAGSCLYQRHPWQSFLGANLLAARGGGGHDHCAGGRARA